MLVTQSTTIASRRFLASSSSSSSSSSQPLLLLQRQSRSPVLRLTTTTIRSFSAQEASDNNPADSPSSSSSSPQQQQGGGVFPRMACIGTGKMAQAMIQPLIAKGVQPADQIAVFDVRGDYMQDVATQYPGVRTANSIPELVASADLVVCAVKPQNITADFLAECRKGMEANPRADETILLSVIAGKPSRAFLPGGFSRIVRSMPNTPATIGQGMTVWSCTPNLTAAERQSMRTILSSTGKSMYVDDESYIDMATSISGSGPAYFFLLMESMIDAGVHMGFPRDQASTLVYHTMLGSTLYAMETGEHPAILRNSVTSPNGTTASALYELENGRFRTVIKDAMWACYRRSLEMGNHDSNVGPGRHSSISSSSSSGGGGMTTSKLHLNTDSDDEDNNSNGGNGGNNHNS